MLSGNQFPFWLAHNLFIRRMWIEEMFGDIKGLELNLLHTTQQLSRLTLAVCILYVWFVYTCEYFNTKIDSTDRQNLSIFRLG